MISTSITREFGLGTPIVSAGMAFASRAELAAAVSNAGGLGTLGADLQPPAALRDLIRSTRYLTGRPIGVDFITPFATREHIDVCIEERIELVVFFWELPDESWLRELQLAGTRVWMQVGALGEARAAARAGVDAIIAQGSEAGGHNRAEAATFSLLPAVIRAVAPVPVLAAGGIVDGRGLAAALALGAEAVWCGTRFAASHEANLHVEYKARILAASVGDTVRSEIFDIEWPDAPARVLRNGIVRESESCGERREDRIGTLHEPIGSTVIGGLRTPMPKFSAILPTPDTEGDFEQMCLTVGEGAGNIDELESAAAIIGKMTAEAIAVIRGRLSALLVQPISRNNPSRRASAAACERDGTASLARTAET